MSEYAEYIPPALAISAPPTVAPLDYGSPEILTFRATIRAISPPWLQTGNAERLLYTIGLHLDTLAEACIAAVKLRFPGVVSGESLPILGRDRRIRRGRLDTDATYAARLNRWLTDHRTRGGPYALLAQLHAHFAPNNFDIQLIYRSGRRFSMDVVGTIVRDDIAFNPDSRPEQWARWWLYYAWPAPVGKRHWGDGGKWGDGGVWGSDLSAQDVADLRVVPRDWNATHCFGRIVLQTSDADVQLSLGDWNAG